MSYLCTYIGTVTKINLFCIVLYGYTSMLTLNNVCVSVYHVLMFDKPEESSSYEWPSNFQKPEEQEKQQQSIIFNLKECKKTTLYQKAEDTHLASNFIQSVVK